MKRKYGMAVLVALTAGVAGWMPLRAGQATPAESTKPGDLAAPVAGSGSVVQAVDGAALKKAVKANKGKVVVVNLWATWCEPCLDEYPSLVKLYDSYRDKGLVLLSVTLDDPEDKGKVEAFVRTQNAKMPVYRRSSGENEEFIAPLDKKWSGAVPLTYVFDRNGKRVGEPILGKHTYEQFEAAIKPLLNK